MGRLCFIGLSMTALLAGQSAGPIKARPKPGAAARTAPPPLVVERPQPAAAPDFKPEHDDPVIAKAMAYANSFGSTLPDFLARQVTTRWSSRNLGRKWKKEDVVEAEVIYAGGRENYRNIRVNGRPLRSFDSLDGTTSTGEYGTVLRNLFHPDTAALFRRGVADVIDGRELRIYDIRVDSGRSHWRIGVNDKSIASAYRGRVWIEEDSGRVFRVEMEAMAFPPGFALASSEIVLEYGPVDIGYEQPLLPVRSENLACFRREMLCRRNEIVFTDYRKFEAETTIDFESVGEVQ